MGVGWSKKYECHHGVSVTSMKYFFENVTTELFEELIVQPFIEEKVVSCYRKLFDCSLFPIKELLKYRKYCLIQETIKNSVLIREGLMARKEAIERIQLEQTAASEIFKTFFSEPGLSKMM